MAQPLVKCVVLKEFSTLDRWGTVVGRKGDIIELSESTAKRLIKFGCVRKHRPKKEEEK